MTTALLDPDTTPAPTPRQQYIAGLRRLADVLEANDDVRLPYDGTTSPVRIYRLHSEDPATDLAADVKAFGGRWAKETDDATFRLRTSLGGERGLRVETVAYREAVCTRRVVGSHTVTEQVPAPDAPTVEVTRVVEDVEWDCAPVLATAVAS